MPHIITGAIADLQKKGMDIGLAGQDRAISVFMRPMEYDEFFPRFHRVESAGTISGGCLNLSKKPLKAGNATALAWFLTTSAGAAVESIDLSSCKLTGATWNPYDGKAKWENFDSNMDGFIALCSVLGKVRTVRLADCGLGARSTAELAKVFRDADAALNLLTIDSTGDTMDEWGIWQNGGPKLSLIHI